MKWLGWIRRAGRGLDAVNREMGPGAAAGRLDRETFARDLQRHRALCNRSGGQFVLLVFEVKGASSAKARRAHTERLAGIVSRRVRVSDVVGVYSADGRQIGVMLPETDAEGAGRFVKAVEELMRRNLNGSWTPSFRLGCDVFAYPEPLEALAVAGAAPAQETVAAKSN